MLDLSYLFRPEAPPVVDVDLKPSRILLQCKLRRTAQVSIRVVAVPKGQALYMMVVGKVRCSIVQERSYAAPAPAFHVHNDNKPFELVDRVETVATYLGFVFFRVPHL